MTSNIAHICRWIWAWCKHFWMQDEWITTYDMKNSLLPMAILLQMALHVIMRVPITVLIAVSNDNHTFTIQKRCEPQLHFYFVNVNIPAYLSYAAVVYNRSMFCLQSPMTTIYWSSASPTNNAWQYFQLSISIDNLGSVCLASPGHSAFACYDRQHFRWHNVYTKFVMCSFVTA